VLDKKFIEILNDFSRIVVAQYGPEIGKGLLAMRVSEELFKIIETESCTPGMGSDGKPFEADTIELKLASGFFSIQKKNRVQTDRAKDGPSAIDRWSAFKVMEYRLGGPFDSVLYDGDSSISWDPMNNLDDARRLITKLFKKLNPTEPERK